MTIDTRSPQLVTYRQDQKGPMVWLMCTINFGKVRRQYLEPPSRECLVFRGAKLC